jgi:uncharacterized protein (TIGR03435 family)
MRTVVLSVVFASTLVFAQAPVQPSASTARYDVVSIKPNIANNVFSNGGGERPDGSFTLINIPITTLIGRAYPPFIPLDMVGLPDWATTARYDVSVTSTLARATPDERAAMMRAMLADRFQLVARVEKREQPAYHLVLARSDGKLGPGIRPSDIDCVDRAAAQRKALADREAAGAASVSPQVASGLVASGLPCVIRMSGDQMEGDITVANLVPFLRTATRRPVFDKTGLTSTYHVTLTFDRSAGLRGPEVAAPDSVAPSVFTAVQQQLGMRLDAVRLPLDVLVIERLERPSEN